MRSATGQCQYRQFSRVRGRPPARGRDMCIYYYLGRTVLRAVCPHPGRRSRWTGGRHAKNTLHRGFFAPHRARRDYCQVRLAGPKRSGASDHAALALWDDSRSAPKGNLFHGCSRASWDPLRQQRRFEKALLGTSSPVNVGRPIRASARFNQSVGISQLSPPRPANIVKIVAGARVRVNTKRERGGGRRDGSASSKVGDRRSRRCNGGVWPWAKKNRRDFRAKVARRSTKPSGEAPSSRPTDIPPRPTRNHGIKLSDAILLPPHPGDYT